MNRTTEKIDIDGHTVELVFAVAYEGDPCLEHLEMGWLLMIDGKQYGGSFPIEKITREMRKFLIEDARQFIHGGEMPV